MESNAKAAGTKGPSAAKTGWPLLQLCLTFDFAVSFDKKKQRECAKRLYWQVIRSDDKLGSLNVEKTMESKCRLSTMHMEDGDQSYRAQQISEAVASYKRAADLGNSDAMDTLASIYQYGKGVECNNKEAIHFYKQASDAGHVKAMCSYASMLEHPTEGEVKYSAIVKLYQRVVDVADADADVEAKSYALFRLATAHEKKGGVGEINNQKSISLYYQAVKLGNHQAMHALALLYENSDDSGSHSKEIFRLYSRAVELNFSPSFCKLGSLYEDGKGCRQDRIKAKALYLRAKRCGDENIASTAVKMLSVLKQSRALYLHTMHGSDENIASTAAVKMHGDYKSPGPKPNLIPVVFHQKVFKPPHRKPLSPRKQRSATPTF